MPLVFTRRNGASFGFIGGLGVLWLLSHRGNKNSALSRLRSSFNEGICYGLGGGWGIIWGIGLLARISQWLEDQNNSSHGHKSSSEVNSTGNQVSKINQPQLKGALPATPASESGTVEVGAPEEGFLKSNSPTPQFNESNGTAHTASSNQRASAKGTVQEEDLLSPHLPSQNVEIASTQAVSPQMAVSQVRPPEELPNGPTVFVQGIAAGMLAAVVLAILTSLGLLAVGPLIFRGRFKKLGQYLILLTGIDFNDARQRQHRRQQSLQGNAIGFGLIMSGAALNWGVEQWDRIFGGEEAPQNP